MNSEDKENILYIFKANDLYGYIKELDLFLYDNNENPFLANDKWSELLDLLPEGIDLEIMLNSFNISDERELFLYLKNPIGDFTFSFNINYKNELIKKSNLNTDFFDFPKVLKCKIEIEEQALFPKKNTNAQKGEIQRLSLSGYQHKLQVSIIDNVIRQDYSDFILKPINENYEYLPINEHLHTSFMQEFGFEVPFNALVYDRRFQGYYYIIKRFDILESGEKLALISLNALIKSKNKYEGSLEQVCELLNKYIISKQEKSKFIKYIYANVLLFNNDLHKKNISFMVKNQNLVLSPAYDIINTHIQRKLGKTQTALPINNKEERIRISDFEKSISYLELNLKQTCQELEGLFEIYKNKYPLYIEGIKKLEFFTEKNKYINKLTETYRKNLKLFEVYLEKKPRFF